MIGGGSGLEIILKGHGAFVAENVEGRQTDVWDGLDKDHLVDSRALNKTTSQDPFQYDLSMLLCGHQSTSPVGISAPKYFLCVILASLMRP